MLNLSRLCRFRLFSVSSLLLVVSFCLAVYCVHLGLLLAMGRAGKKATIVYEVTASTRELPGIPKVVLASFNPQLAVHDVKQDETVRASVGPRPSDSLAPNCPAGHVRKGKSVCVECSTGKFSLPGWIACRNLLSCDDFKQNVRIRQKLPVDGEVFTSSKINGWSYYHADWEGFKTILVCPNISSSSTQLLPELIHDLRTAQSSLHVIGLCSIDSCVLYFAPHPYKWAPLLSVVSDPVHPSSTVLQTWQSWYVRLVVLQNTVNALSRLHDATGKYTLCGGMSVEEILQQFLVNTENGQVSFVGYDNVISRTGSPKSSYAGPCSMWHQRSTQALYAPEERAEANGGMQWYRASIDQHSHFTSHSTADLWKVPDVADFILGGVPGGDLVRDYLAALHVQCKSVMPAQRPSFHQLLSAYWETLQLLSSVSKTQH